MNVLLLSKYYISESYAILQKCNVAAKEYLQVADRFLENMLRSNSMSENLLITPLSKGITYTIILSAWTVLVYETIYWVGIYLGLWEYHAKDIFTEVPIHCAHVYVRLNVARNKDIDNVREYYRMKQKSKYNVISWKTLLQLKALAFLQEFIKYHFEFSPEDFEGNPEPEYGSTIEHLRQKTLTLLNSSVVFSQFTPVQSINQVLVYNSSSQEIGSDKNLEYLSKCNIGTGDIIDCIVLY